GRVLIDHLERGAAGIAVDGVIGFWVLHGEHVLGAVEAVPAARDAVRPGHQPLPTATGAHGFGRVAGNDRNGIEGIGTHARTGLDDDRLVVAVDQDVFAVAR